MGMTGLDTKVPGHRPVVIVSTVLPRWIADFGSVSTYFSKAGHGVTLFAPRPEQTASTGWRSPEAIAEAQGRLPPAVDLRYLPGDSTHEAGLTAALRTQLESLRIALQRPRPLVFLWNPYAIVMFGPILRLLGVPVIFMVTGLGWTFSAEAQTSLRRRVIHAVYRLVFRGRRHRILVHNKDDKQVLVERFSIRPQQIYVTPGCGVDPAEFPFVDAPQPSPRPIVLVPVRLLKQKGVLDAAEASRLLSGRGIDHEMWFTSNPDPTHPSALTAEEIEATKARCPDVRFKGFQASLVPLYAQAAAVCVPTYYQEGLPTALLEAASMGRPIVTCDNWGGRDFIRDGLDGHLVPPKSPEALAAALGRILTVPPHAERLRRSAHQRFLDGFTKQHMLEITLTACRDLTEDML